jgi:hypothetical protein
MRKYFPVWEALRFRLIHPGDSGVSLLEARFVLTDLEDRGTQINVTGD